MFKFFLLIIFIGLGLISLSCNSVNSKNEKTANTAKIPLSNQEIDNTNELCAKLSELRRMPMKDAIAGDTIYDGLLRVKNKAVPCLIDKITDVEGMEDPREAPHIENFKVGDAAVFMLSKITEVPIEESLPKDVSKNWQTEGVYTYFAYVEKPENRKKIQEWWREWMEKKLK